MSLTPEIGKAALVRNSEEIATGKAKFKLTRRLIFATAVLLAGIAVGPAAAGPSPVASMKPATAPPLIRATEICALGNAGLYGRNVHLNTPLRAPGDIAALALKDWQNLRHVTAIAGLIFFLVLALAIREWYLERRNRRQIASLAYVEQRRSRILEDQPLQAAGRDTGADHGAGFSPVERRSMLVPDCRWSNAR